jgi:hypothetical protein
MDVLCLAGYGARIEPWGQTVAQRHEGRTAD